MKALAPPGPQRLASQVRGVFVGFALACIAAAPASKARRPELRSDLRYDVRFAGSTQAQAYRLAVARTPQQQAQGLMNVRSLPPAGGMLFVFDSSEVRTFWMKDTFIGLDLVFIDAACRVIGTVTQARPHDETGLSVHRPSQYVVELAAGTVQKDGLRTGQLAHFALDAHVCPRPAQGANLPAMKAP